MGLAKFAAGGPLRCIETLCYSVIDPSDPLLVDVLGLKLV